MIAWRRAPASSEVSHPVLNPNTCIEPPSHSQAVGKWARELRRIGAVRKRLVGRRTDYRNKGGGVFMHLDRREENGWAKAIQHGRSWAKTDRP